MDAKNCANDSLEFLSALAVVYLTSVLNKQIVQDPTRVERSSRDLERRKTNKENILISIIMPL